MHLHPTLSALLGGLVAAGACGGEAAGPDAGSSADLPTHDGPWLDTDPPTPMPPARGSWVRGSLHAHSAPLSGDCRGSADKEVTDEQVVAWLSDNGWDFLFFTEHDDWADRSGLSTPDLLVLNGMELTTKGDGNAPVHVNALGLEAFIETPVVWEDKVEAALDHGALPVVLHPGWSLQLTHGFGGSEAHAVSGLLRSPVRHLEIYNTKERRDVPDPGQAERLWDALLTAGKRFVGLAADDSHGLKHIGGGWVMVWVARLDRAAVLEAVGAGHVYASTGVQIRSIHVADGTIRVEADADELQVVGAGGERRATVAGGSVTFDFSGEPYVRVRAHLGDARAWTQAYSPDDEVTLGSTAERPPEATGDRRDPAVVVVEDLSQATAAGDYPGADIDSVVATLPDGETLLPARLAWRQTRLLYPEDGRNRHRDPAAVLTGDDLVCGTGPREAWAGFACLGGPGGQVGVVFPRRLPPGTVVRVTEVDPEVCPSAAAVAEPYRVHACREEDDSIGACQLVGECDGGGCELTLGST